MNSPKPTNAEVAAAKIMDQAYAEMENTSYNWLRGRFARRCLVVLTFASAFLCLVGIALDRDFVTAAGVIAYVTCLFLGRRAVRLVADLPDECLDERLLTLRNEAYRGAYVAISALLSLSWLGVLIAYGFLELEVARAHVYAVVFTLFMVTFSLPTLSYAWWVDRV